MYKRQAEQIAAVLDERETVEPEAGLTPETMAALTARLRGTMSE